MIESSPCEMLVLFHRVNLPIACPDFFIGKASGKQ